MATILYLQFPQSNLQYTVSSEGGVFVGRAASCDVDLTNYFFGDQLHVVSRQHFKLLYQKGEGFIIVDLSYNGTQVNGDDLAKEKPRILRDGDVIKLARNETLTIKVTIDDDPDVTDAIAEPELLLQPAASSLKTGLYFDKTRFQFVVDGRPIPHEHLTKLEVQLMTYLYENTGRLCSFDDIAAHVWDDPAWAPENNTISRAVANLRKKLNQFSSGAGDYIQNVRGQGYKMSVEEAY